MPVNYKPRRWEPQELKSVTKIIRINAMGKSWGKGGENWLRYSLRNYLHSDFSCASTSLVSLFWSFSNGNTTTGAAGTVCQRSFKSFLNLKTISLRNSSSRVNRSNIKNERMYLKGTMSRTVADDNRTSATSLVIWKASMKSYKNMDAKQCPKAARVFTEND